ncbi:SRP72 domain protein [Rhizoctonia solani]|uniref:SRP72 domain protein n=1 Tax=Rhizoctonia solani TaxID=456999 RepID=A0A8H8P6N0_9AGAM|nr:SRP72 domain protein [Rhizoctonia solani]QRW25297.1 SRP72 domain protein [Rhizoctonia solani]
MPSQKPGAAKKTPASTKGGQKPQTGEKKGNYNPRRKIHTLDPAASKKPKPAEVRIKQLFASLCAQIDGAHLTNAIKTFLRLTPDDADVIQTKLFLLLQTDQYARALEIVETVSGGSDSRQLEKAYLLYRLHKEKEAKAVVDQAKAKGHLTEAYRLGDYSVSKEIYDRILDEGELNAEEQTDINTNLSAVQSHIDFLQSGFYDSLRASGVNVSQLEDAPAPAPPLQPIHSPAPLKGPRKGRLPKHVVLGVTPMPDPERWIKKRERTYVTFAQGRKGKGKGRKEGATAGYSQGVNVAPAVAGVMEGGGSGSGHVPKSGGGGKGRKKSMTRCNECMNEKLQIEFTQNYI